MADVGVRAARREDVPAVTDTQIRAWKSGYRRFLPEEPLEQMTGQAARDLWARQWEEAVVAPPTPRHRLLVAVETTDPPVSGRGDHGGDFDALDDPLASLTKGHGEPGATYHGRSAPNGQDGPEGPERRGPGAQAVGGTGAQAVVGIASHAPADDPDLDPSSTAELLTLLVDPDHIHRGHGSRLLNATVDHLREDGFATVVTWVFADDKAMLGFLESAGWGPDEAERVLDMGRPVRMIRLTTDIS
jgi:ribosomal protein S18 acetylase RimI-like enzyme